MIDSPGVVVDTAGDTETDSVLKGVVRGERLETPEDYIDAIQEAVKKEHIAAMYGLPKSGEDTWSTSEELLEKIAIKCGRLLKGGEPCLRTAAIMMINDFQRGKLPHYVAPPELKEDEDEKKNKIKDGEKDTTKIEGVTLEKQNLDSVQRDMDVEEEKEEGKSTEAVEDTKEEDEEDSDEEDEAEDTTAVVGKLSGSNE